MVSCLFGNVFLKIAIGYCCFVCERLVELDDKVILEVFGNSSAIAGGIADNLVFLRNHFDIRAFVESVHYDIRMFIFRKSEAEKDSAFRRGHFRHDVMFGEIYFIIIRSGDLPFVGKPACALFFVKLRFAYYGHDRELSVVVNPRTGLMRLLETANLVSGISVLPAVTHFSCLRSPEVHPPGTGNGRISITC